MGHPEATLFVCLFNLAHFAETAPEERRSLLATVHATQWEVSTGGPRPRALTVAILPVSAMDSAWRSDLTGTMLPCLDSENVRSLRCLIITLMVFCQSGPQCKCVLPAKAGNFQPEYVMAAVWCFMDNHITEERPIHACRGYHRMRHALPCHNSKRLSRA